MTPTEALQPAMMIPANATSAAQQVTTETQTTVETTQQQTQTAQASASQQQTQTAEASTSSQQQTIVDLPMATAPTSPARRQPLPMPRDNNKMRLHKAVNPSNKGQQSSSSQRKDLNK